jgi:hypothetical protein
MRRHPYRPANRRGHFNRVTTTSDSVFLPQRDRGPCLYTEGGTTCGRPERQAIHHQPFGHVYETKTRDMPVTKGVGKDAPVF